MNSEVTLDDITTENELKQQNIDFVKFPETDPVLVTESNKGAFDAQLRDLKMQQICKERLELSDKVKHLAELNIKLEDEKLALEQHVDATTMKMTRMYQNREKIRDELKGLKEGNVQLKRETVVLKSIILKKEDELKTLNVTLSSKTEQLANFSNKEIQIRRIAKKYKDSFFELRKQEQERVASFARNSLSVQASSAVGSRTVLTADANAKRVPGCDSFRKQHEEKICIENQHRIAALTQATGDCDLSNNPELSPERIQSVNYVLKSWKDLDMKIKDILQQNGSKDEIIAQLTCENDKLSRIIRKIHVLLQWNSNSRSAIIPQHSLNVNSLRDGNSHHDSSSSRSITVDATSPIELSSSSLNDDRFPRNERNDYYTPVNKKTRLDSGHKDDGSGNPSHSTVRHVDGLSCISEP